MSAENTMRAVVFRGPYKVAVEERPVPRIQDAGDILVKVTYTALCGRFVFFCLLLGGERLIDWYFIVTFMCTVA